MSVSPWEVAIERHILLEGLVDYIGLWEIAPMADSANSQDAKKKILALLMKLLDDEIIVAGSHSHMVFCRWRLSPSEVIARIEAEWNQLGHPPNLEENFVYFTLTDKGREIAKQLPEAKKVLAQFRLSEDL